MSVVTDLTVKVSAREVVTGDLRDATATHLFQVLANFESGTGATQADKVWSDTRSAAAAADTIDLLGTLTDITGTTVSFVDVVGIAIKNNATTTGYDLLIGAGSNPFLGWLNDATDKMILPPGGVLVWTAGTVDDTKPTAGTGDIITIDPSANTVSYSIIVWGRSA